MAKQKQVAFDAGEGREVCESLEKCREMLLIGLASYGELERLENAQEVQQMCGMIEIPEELLAIHPTGSAATVSDFAAALINVDQVILEIRKRTEQEPEAQAKAVQS